MGIIIPRPPMRSREKRIIRRRLKLHAELMAKYQTEGMSKEAASKRAYADVMATDVPAIGKAEGR